MAKPKPNLVKRCAACLPYLGKRVVGKRVGRVKCWCVRLMVGGPLVLVTAVVVITQTPLLGYILLPRMSEALGMEISASRVYVARSGGLVLLDVTVRVPEVPGKAGEFVRVERLDAAVRWWPTILGDPTLTQLVATGPIVRLSQSIEDGSLNVAWIPAPPGGIGDIGGETGVGSTTLSLFEIIVNNMTLEIGEHGPGGYQVLKRIELNGTLSPSGTEADARYDIVLEGNPIASDGSPLSLEGYVNPDGMWIELTGFALHDWPSESIPSPSRELMKALALRGRLERIVFSYEIGKGLTAKIVLRDGEMNLPVSPTAPGNSADQLATDNQIAESPLRVTGVDGEVTFTPSGLFANATGLVGDLPTQITLDVDGLDLNSPFTLTLKNEGFSLEKNPALLPFAPPAVHKRLLGFSSPTGMVDASVTIVRGPPTQDGPGEITFSGEMLLTQGVAAWARIPYEFENITAHIRFDQDRVDIVRIEGESASGAKLTGDGWIAPTSGVSETFIELRVTNLPTDSVLREALGTKYGPIMDAVFDRDAYQNLLDRGLIITRAQQIEFNRRLADPSVLPDERVELRRILARPMFELGGRIETTITIHRPPVENAAWEVAIDAALIEGGILAHGFPMPIIGREIRVLTAQGKVELLRGSITTLSGKDLDVSLDIDISDGFKPDIHVSVTDFPVDDLLIGALPDSEDGLSGRSVLHDLGVQGLADIRVHITNREDGTVGFDANATFDSLSIAPQRRDRAHGIWSRALTGQVLVSERDLSVRFDGNLERNAQEIAADGPTPGRPIGHVEAEATVVYATENDPGSFRASILVTDLDVQARVEDFVAVFSEPAAVQIESLRHTHDPLGSMNASVSIQSGHDGVVETQIRIDNVHDAELNLLDGRFVIADLEGELTVNIGRNDVLKFRKLRSDLSFDGMAVGIVELNGDAPLSLFSGEEFSQAPEQPFEIRIEDGRFESPLTRRIVERFTSDGIKAWYNQAEPSGVYNATTQITKDGTTGTLEPHSFAFDNDGERAQFGPIEGVIEFHPGGGTMRDVQVQGDEWTLTTDGRWESPGEGVISLDATFAIEAQRLSDSLRAAMPRALRQGMDSLDLGITGPINIDQGRLQYTIRPNFEDPFVEATASGTFMGAQFLAGVEIDQSNGSFSSAVSIDPGEAYPTFDLDFDIDQMLVNGIAMQSVDAHIMRDADGLLELTSFSGGCHGGTVTVQARVWPREDGTSEYFANLQLASVRLYPVIMDLDREKQPSAEADSAASTDARDAEAASYDDDLYNTRGMLEGTLSIGGTVGDARSRRGTGRFRVSGGQVMRSPALVVLIELTSFQFPAGAKLDYATLDLFIDGDTVAIEDVSIYSKRIKIWGFGTLNWPTQELDMRFFAGSASAIPLLGELFGVWKKLVSFEVTGKIGEQRIVPKIFDFTQNPFTGAIHLGGRGMIESNDENTLKESKDAIKSNEIVDENTLTDVHNQDERQK